MRIPSAGLSLYLLTNLFLLSSLSCLAQKPKLIVPIGHSRMIQTIASSLDGRHLFSSGRTRTIQWDRNTGQIRQTWPIPALGLSTHGKYLVSFEKDTEGAVRLIETATGLERFFGTPKNFGQTPIAITADERLLAITDHQEKDIQIWDIGCKLQKA